MAGHHPIPAHPELVGWASLPADTFVPGSEPSGYFTTATPSAPYPGQPVQGFSAIHALGDGSYLVMSDNGFGAKANSQDFGSRVHRIRPNTDTGRRRRRPRRSPQRPVAPDRRGPSGATAAAPPTASLPAGYTCPTPDRGLTGWDFDTESMQVAPDGTFWFGDEFGPFLLHTDCAAGCSRRRSRRPA